MPLLAYKSQDSMMTVPIGGYTHGYFSALFLLDLLLQPNVT
jgi:hypothetical protein